MIDMTFESEHYLAKPLSLMFSTVKEQAEVIYKSSIIIRRCAAHESFFTDYIRGCSGECEGFCKDLSDGCEFAKTAVSAAIMKPDALNWEVWRKDKDGEALDFVGILRLEKVLIGCDATAHYFFFDGKLKDKTSLLKAWKTWLFSEHGKWIPLHRVTIEVPTHAFALARHAHKYLDFSGPYDYKFHGSKLQVEGVRELSVRWRGDWHDTLIMGCING